jgi:NADPH-ferrihemoprotein reductase
MTSLDLTDYGLLAAVMVLSATYLYWKNSNSTSKNTAPPKLTLSELKKSSMGGSSRSLVSKLESLGNEKMVILFYGSQTGTAEDLAERTQKDISAKLNIPTIVLDLEDYDMEDLQEWKNFDSERNWVCGFYMATYSCL